MAANNSVCGVCDLQYLTTPSTHWCVQCEEALCADCKDHHNVLKISRNHKVLLISDYQSLPSFVTDIQQVCIYHNERYQLYCAKHEHPICNRCIMEHGKCGEVFPLEEVVGDVKTSEVFLDIEQSLMDILTNIKSIRVERESNITSIKNQKKAIIEEHSQLKDRVIQHLEKLERKLLKELDRIELDCCDKIRSVVSSLQDKEEEINLMRVEIQNMMKYASDLQTFLSIREIHCKINENEGFLHSLIENKNLPKIEIESTIDDKIPDILLVKRFGSMKVKIGPSANIKIQRTKEKQAQIEFSEALKSINNMKLEFKRKLKTACKVLRGASVTINGDILVSNYETNNEKVLAMNTAGQVEYTISLTEPFSSFDLVCLDDITFATSTGYSIKNRGISIIDLTSRKVIKFIDLPKNPYGIAFDGKSLICCVEDKDLHVISLTDFRITTIPNTFSPKLSYVATLDEKIFRTNAKKHIVTCCLYSGEPVWEFNDKNILNIPRGITIDMNGNAFITGEYSCNVVVISSDGKQCKQLLCKEDELNKPTAIFFDKMRRQLLVTNDTIYAYVYNVSYR